MQKKTLSDFSNPGLEAQVRPVLHKAHRTWLHKEVKACPPTSRPPTSPPGHRPVYPKQRLLGQRQSLLLGTRTPGVRARLKDRGFCFRGLCLGTVGRPSLRQAISLLHYFWDLLEAVGDQLFPIFPGDRTGDSKLKLLGRIWVPTSLPTPVSLQGPFPRVASGRSPPSLARGSHTL